MQYSVVMGAGEAATCTARCAVKHKPTRAGSVGQSESGSSSLATSDAASLCPCIQFNSGHEHEIFTVALFDDNIESLNDTEIKIASVYMFICFRHR